MNKLDILEDRESRTTSFVTGKSVMSIGEASHIRETICGLRIAFLAMGGQDWTAGPIYLKNMFYALRHRYGRRLKFYLLAPANYGDIRTYAHSMEPDGVVPYDMPQSWTALWVIDRLCQRLLSREILVERVLNKHGIDVVFGYKLGYKYRKKAVLSWLPDFQHRHLPEMFSKAERLARDRAYLRSARLSDRVIVANDFARKDFEAFAPTFAYKVKALHPITYVPADLYKCNLDSILKLYALPEKFVYLPNQFWRHKNHEIAFKALRVLGDRDIKAIIVCTGLPNDPRDPTHFPLLWQKLSVWNLREQVIYLGLIPREHVLQLMRQCICVLNPSLFEGWGISVDEARSVGKQLLLSDIPSHREHSPPKAVFFDPHSCEDLVEKLGQIWLKTKPGPDAQLEREAKQSLSGRLRAYAEGFMSVVHEAIQEARKRHSPSVAR